MASRHSFIRAVTPTWSLRDAFQSEPTAQNASYERVNEGEDLDHEPVANEAPQQRRHTFLGALRQLATQCSPRLVLLTIALIAFLFVVGKTLPDGHHDTVVIRGQADHMLHLLIPSSNKPDIGFCKTELTAAILRYPTPLILNYEASGRSTDEQERDKILSITDHLNGLGEDRDENLAIVLSSSDSWFQLRSEVYGLSLNGPQRLRHWLTMLSNAFRLMERYYRIVQQADKSSAENNEDAAPFTHRVVLAAQNHCSGHTLDELACFAPPDNPFDRASTMRYLNADLMVGPIKDLRKLFNRVNDKASGRQDDEISQQALLAEIFGEQEFRREYVRQGSWSSKKKKLNSVLAALGYSKSSITDNVVGRKLLDDPQDAGYEMGIELDYGNELGLSISRQADTESMEWIRYGKSYRDTHSPLPLDIARSQPPFWSTMPSSLPTHKTWADLPLLTSKRTGGIPAVIGMAGQGRSSAQRWLDWRTFWLHAHARALWDAQKELPRLPLMSVVDGNGTQHTFWNQELRMDRDGANWKDGGWKRWTDHCGWDQAGEVVLLDDQQP